MLYTHSYHPGASSSLKLVDTDDDLPGGFNYLIVDDDKIKIIMKKFKTHKIYGDVELGIKNKKLISALRAHIENEGLENGDFIFGLSKKKIKSDMSKKIIDAFKKASGKPISVNIARHIYASEFYKKNRSWSEIEAFSELMGNSPTMNQKYKRMDAPAGVDEDDKIKAKFH